MEPGRRSQRIIRTIARVGLLPGIAIAVSLMPLAYGGTHATAAEAALPKIKLDSIKNIRKAFDWIAREKPFETQLPEKKKPSPVARFLANHRGKIKALAHELVSQGEWACNTAVLLEREGKLHQRPPDPWARSYAQVAALANGAEPSAAGRLVDALEGVTDGAIRETIAAACD